MKLSKSKFCKGVQCPKILWLDAYKSELAEDTANESILRTGNEVGDLAMQYFGDFEEVAWNISKQQMVADTQELLTQGERIIAEASFLYNDLFCSVDILKRNEDGTFDIIEVKSSTAINDIYYYDMAFQYHVVSNAGLQVAKVYNMHLNSQYVRQGELDLQELFVLEDCTEKVLSMQDTVLAELQEMNTYNATDEEPFMEVGVHCQAPYFCAYHTYCHRHIPAQSVFDIHGMTAKKKYELYYTGIVDFDDIIARKPKMSQKQLQQVEAVYYNQKPVILQDKIKEFIDTLTYPLYYLDFETYQQAVPLYDGVTPYTQIPFQYSLHVQKTKGGSLEHYEFLGKEGEDPRRALAEQICRDIPMDVCTLAYNMAFEKNVLKNLAQQYPDLADHLLNIVENIKDLMIPFQKQHYYCKEMMGSYSIKYVLPALCSDDPELDYHALEGIHNGSEAMSAYADLVNHTAEEIAVIRKNLLAYCRLDTLAMVKILEKLHEVI